VTGSAVVQVFGRNDSQATRRALRFFKERRMAISFVDVTKRAPAAGELRRFSQRHGARALLDEQGRAYREAGLAYLRLTDDEIVERLLADPSLLRLPLVRHGQEVTIGVDEEAWRRWLARPGPAAPDAAQ
jgi:arsenate reductase-like glutaredoxin family protein